MTGSTDAAGFLRERRDTIVGAAEEALMRRTDGHYRRAGRTDVHARLETLFDHVADAVARRDVVDLLRYTRTIARERFDDGYDLSEVQLAFNALEEATWTLIFSEVSAGDVAETLGLVTTALGAAKDTLGRTWVELATKKHAPTLDLRALFAGTER